MRRPRLYTEQPLSPDDLIQLEPGPAAHLTRVLRRRVGDALVLFNGDGYDYPARLEAVERRAVRVRVLAREAVAAESPLEVHLLQGVSRGERMDWAIQKAVELGVQRITPVRCERTVVRLDARRWERRWQHWRGVMVAACEQCGRARLPVLTPVQDLAEALATPSSALGLMLDPRGARAWEELDPKAGVRLLIGPEGGLSEAERARARQAGFVAVALGPRTLRTETAAVAALAVLQARWGDLR